MDIKEEENSKEQIILKPQKKRNTIVEKLKKRMNVVFVITNVNAWVI